MADPRFYTKAAPKTLGELAQLSGAEIGSGSASGYVIYDVGALESADKSQISFLDNVKYKDVFRATGAGACIVSPEAVALAPAGVHLLLSKNPYKAYALVAQAFYPDVPPAARIAASARVHETATVAGGCVIDDNAVIAEGVELGQGVWVGANAVIGRNVKIGAQTRIGANATISHAHIGSNVRIYPGCCIGQDGFGFAIDPTGHVKVPQLGRVIIHDSVEVGANTTIDRGSGPDTIIGQGTWIDNLVQIAHNVQIGRGCVIVGQVGVSGSTVLEDFVVLAGQVGVAGHLRIGRGARIGAKSGILRDIPPGSEIMGYPGLPIKQFYKQVAYLNRLLTRKT